MKNNLLIKILCSLPMILIVMYFIPFLGICLILLRYFIYNGKHYSTAITLIICGILILLPKIVDKVLQLFKLELVIPYLNEILKSSGYVKILNYSKLLIIVGIVFIVLSYVFSVLVSKIGIGIKKYFEEEQRKDYEISQ